MEIPDNLKPLFEILGQEKALEIVKAYEGSSVYFSKAILRRYNHEQIIKDYCEGVSYKELADIYGYSESYVRRICNLTRK